MKQKGFSLIELMVSLTIGLILLLGLISVYLTASKMTQRSDFLVSMNQSANEVFYLLGRDFGRAGFVDASDTPKENFVSENNVCSSNTEKYNALIGNDSSEFINSIYMRLLNNDSYAARQNIDIGNGVGTTMNVQSNRFMTPIGIVSCGNMQPVQGCDGTFTSNPSASQSASCQASNEVQQSVQIAFQGRRSAALSADAVLSDEVIYDCTGNSIQDSQLSNAATLNGFIVNQYYLKKDQNDQFSLFCRGNAGNQTEVALVPNVVEMRFNYALTGMNTEAEEDIVDDETSKIVTEYETATALNNANPQTDLGWARVTGVEVCIVVSSELDENQMTSSELASLQGTVRPSCQRDNEGKFINITKEDNNRFYKRYVKVFQLPNTIYSYLGSGN